MLYHGWRMDVTRAWMESDLDVIMVATCRLTETGWRLIWTLSWLAHGDSAGTDGVSSGRYQRKDRNSNNKYRRRTCKNAVKTALAA